MKVHARGEYLATLAGGEPIATLAPVYALEGKASIAPVFVTGPFGWRVAPLLSALERQRFGLMGEDDLADFAPGAYPRAILTGIHGNDAESEIALVDFAQKHGYAPMPAPDQGTLWLRPEAEWNGTVRLVTAALPKTPLSPGESFVVTLYLQAIQSLDENLNVLVRLTAADGQDLLRSEGWPWGRPTSTWQPGDVWPDGHTLTIPQDAAAGPYKLAVSFYYPETLELMGQPVTVDYIVVRPEESPPAPVMAPVAFGDGITLIDSELPGEPWTLGEEAAVRLTWQAETAKRRRYTTFVHMVGPNGLVAQYDQEPFGGFFPTSDWLAGVPVSDVYPLELPDDLPAGEYQLLAGLYEPETGERLSWLDHGAPAGDAFPFATIQVR
jgi:hypothetical protein